ncbi:SagB/ThcOx family dehydrogenase [Kytococcus sp. Marseille-QA3725]
MRENEDPLEWSEEVGEGLVRLARENGVEGGTASASILNLLTRISTAPDSTFATPPEHVRAIPSSPPMTPPEPALASDHTFFDVVKARASRRDFTGAPFSADLARSLLAWSFGKRGDVPAYDWDGFPQRYVPSAGGLVGIDAYCLAFNVEGLEPGSYYYDYERGMVPIFEGGAAHVIAGAMPGQEWVERAAMLVVLVANTSRVDQKYGSMAAKLLLLEGGATAAHLELVATALECRACILGGLPHGPIREVLNLDETRVPLVSLAMGARA